MDKCVELWSNKNDTILYFTSGSGTVGYSCIKLNRNFIGIEINKEYYDIAKERIEQMKNE